MTLRPPVVVVLRHEVKSLFTDEQCALPVEECDIHLVTHRWADQEKVPPVLSSVTPCNLDTELSETLDRVIKQSSAQRVTTQHEKCLIEVAAARDRHGLPGLGSSGMRLFRDKVAMKAAVAEANAMDVPALAWPGADGTLPPGSWVLKPRCGLGAEGAVIIPTGAVDLRDVTAGLSPEDFEFERFIGGPMHHCDSLVRDGQVVFSAVSRYIGAPIAFRRGGKFGSIQLAAGPTADLDHVPENRDVLAALNMTEGVTHLEYFVGPAGRRVFCEVACRPGGGGIPRLLLRSTGVDLVREAYRAELGLAPSRIPEARRHADAAVFALVGYYPGASVPHDYQPGVTRLDRIQGTSFGNPSERPRHAADFDVIDILRGSEQAMIEVGQAPTSEVAFHAS